MSATANPQRRIIPIVRAETLIPAGMYCYTPLEAPSPANDYRYRVQPCPYWSVDAKAELEHGVQLAGYCGYLQRGDWMAGHLSLLWDQVKECGINAEEEAPLFEYSAPRQG